MLSRFYPKAPINSEELAKRLEERWHESGDVCFSHAQIRGMDLNDQMALETIAQRHYGRRHGGNSKRR